MFHSVARSRLLPFSVAAASSALAYAASDTAGGFTAAADKSADGPLSPNEFRDLKLLKKEKLTHNSYHLSFELPGGASANMPVASCLLTKAMLQGPGDDKPKVVVRPYTPVSKPDAAGHLDLVIKAYPAGKMSKFLGDLSVGDSVAFKGPIPKYPYSANSKKEIGMVAGGTGITPMLQVAEHILDNPADTTKVSLLFANVSEGDILLKDKIDGLASKHPDRFKVFYVVDKPNWGGIFWKGGVGYVTKDMLAAHMPAPSLGSDALVMVCGPPGMMNVVSGDKAPDKSQGELSGLLKAMGYAAEQVYKF